MPIFLSPHTTSNTIHSQCLTHSFPLFLVFHKDVPCAANVLDDVNNLPKARGGAFRLCKSCNAEIRRILVPDPRRRITIEEIWKHPFLHKYDKELGFQGEKSTMEYWVGPMPSISHWQPLTPAMVDREILRYLRTLWHSEQEEVLMKRLLCKE